MACKRSAVRSRLPPPSGTDENAVSRSPSSRGLGHHPFAVSTGVRIPVGTPGLPGSGRSNTLSAPGGYSSAGRALAWHARGQRFDPAYLHQRADSRGKSAVVVPWSPSSRGLGHHPFTVSTGVRIPVGTPGFQPGIKNIEAVAEPPMSGFFASAAAVVSPVRGGRLSRSLPELRCREKFLAPCNVLPLPAAEDGIH